MRAWAGDRADVMLQEAEPASSGWTSVVGLVVSSYLSQGQQQAGSDYTVIKELLVFCTSVSR